MSADSWKVCSACRTPIGFGQTYTACSVSTCARGRNALFFCSVACWDVHLGSVRHRESWAVEVVAPSREEAARLERDEPAASAPSPSSPPLRAVGTATPTTTVNAPPVAHAPVALGVADQDEILIVVSKLKKYVRERSGMNTSDAVAKLLSDHVRSICDDAIRTAGADGRRTVLDRDVPRVRRP